MTPRQKAFITAYLGCRNSRKAAVEAGYSAKTAYSAGPRLLKDPEIVAAIRSATNAAALVEDEKNASVVARVIQEYERLAFLDPAQCFDEVTGEMLPLHQMPEDVRRAITSFGKKKFKFANKVAALDGLAEVLGMKQESAGMQAFQINIHLNSDELRSV